MVEEIEQSCDALVARPNCCTIDDLDDNILSKIFISVVQPFTSTFEVECKSVEGEDHEQRVVGFEHLTTIPLVCRRWREIINGTPQLLRYVRICCWGWPKQMSNFWWAKHANQLEGVALSGHTTWGGLDISAFNVGVLSLFGRNLRILRLIKCFHRNFMGNALRAIENLRSLQELCVWGHVAFFNNARGMMNLTKLTKVTLRRCSSPHKILHLIWFPTTITHLALENVDILPKELLRISGLKDLTLSYSRWNGALLPCVADMAGLEMLAINSSNPIMEIPEALSGTHVFHNIPELKLLKVTIHSLRIPEAFNFVASHVRALQKLHLENCTFETAPSGMFELPHLEELILNHGSLRELPQPTGTIGLRLLDLSYNDLQEVPPAIERMARLTTIKLCSNPLKFTKSLDGIALLPELICVKFGWDEIRDDKRDVLDARCLSIAAGFNLGSFWQTLRDRRKGCRLFI